MIWEGKRYIHNFLGGETQKEGEWSFGACRNLSGGKGEMYRESEVWQS